MSKICIIGTSNIKHISLISLYTRFFQENRIPFDIVYIDRYGIEEKIAAEHIFRFHEDKMRSPRDKLFGYIRFRKYVKGIVRQNDYSLLITWQTTTAYILFDLLLRRFKKRYIVNVRDYIAENNRLVKRLLSRLVRSSAFTAISSEGFLEFLPQADYVKVNSINPDLVSGITAHRRSEDLPYKIGFVGNCRYFREAYRLIDALGNDERFELWYCGTNSDTLAEYARERSVENVRIVPAFDTEETVEIMDRFDMINSAFGADAMDNRTLMPIRLYTAAAMHLPVLASGGSFLGREVDRHRIGYVIDSYDNLGDSLAEYYLCLEDDALSKSCDAFIEESMKENRRFYQELKNLVSQ